MYVTRLASMIRNRVSIEELRTDAGYDRIRNTVASHVTLAWIFVTARAVHSLVHCTINVITLRFGAYFISCLALFGMWARFGLSALS
jgi:hypothetical protein